MKRTMTFFRKKPNNMWFNPSSLWSLLYDVFKTHLVQNLVGRTGRKKRKRTKEDRRVFAIIVYCYVYDPIRLQRNHLSETQNAE